MNEHPLPPLGVSPFSSIFVQVLETTLKSEELPSPRQGAWVSRPETSLTRESGRCVFMAANPGRGRRGLPHVTACLVCNCGRLEYCTFWAPASHHHHRILVVPFPAPPPPRSLLCPGVVGRWLRLGEFVLLLGERSSFPREVCFSYVPLHSAVSIPK